MNLKEFYLQKVTAMSQDVYTKSEEVNGFDELAEQMFDISNSIGDGCHKYLNNVEYSFTEWNEKHHKIPDNLLAKFVKTCGIISKHQINTKNGFKSELHVKSQLEAYVLKTGNSKLLTNIELSYDGLEGEIDDILITDKAIFIIEVKGLSGNATINKNGHLQTKDKKVDYKRNIADQLNNEYKLLWFTLKNANILSSSEKIKIETIIINEKEECEITNHCKEIKNVLHLHEAISYISEYNGESIYDIDTINNINNGILKNKVELVHKLDVDVAQFKEDFAEIMAIISSVENVCKTFVSTKRTDEQLEIVNNVLYTNKAEKPKTNIVLEVFKALGWITVGVAATKVTVDYCNGDGIWRDKV